MRYLLSILLFALATLPALAQQPGTVDTRFNASDPGRKNYNTIPIAGLEVTGNRVLLFYNQAQPGSPNLYRGDTLSGQVLCINSVTGEPDTSFRYQPYSTTNPPTPPNWLRVQPLANGGFVETYNSISSGPNRTYDNIVRRADGSVDTAASSISSYTQIFPSPTGGTYGVTVYPDFSGPAGRNNTISVGYSSPGGGPGPRYDSTTVQYGRYNGINDGIVLADGSFLYITYHDMRPDYSARIIKPTGGSARYVSPIYDYSRVLGRLPGNLALVGVRYFRGDGTSFFTPKLIDTSGQSPASVTLPRMDALGAQPQGGILLLDSAGRVRRYLPSGREDSTWRPAAMLPQQRRRFYWNQKFYLALSDGAVLLADSFTSIGGVPRSHLARLHAGFNITAGLSRQADNQLVIYPNPSRGTVAVCLPKASPARLRLLSPDGRRIRERITGSAEDAKLEGLPPGVYILEVLTDKATMRGRVVVQ